MPTDLEGTTYYEPNDTGKYERALKAQLEWANKVLIKKD
jgi:hypothetical protein